MRAETVRRLVGVLVFGASLLAAHSSRAQEESLYLEYQAGPDCPSRAQFEEQVRARTARARFVEQPGGVRRFLVAAYPEDGEPLFAYEFVFQSPDMTILRIPWVTPSASVGSWVETAAPSVPGPTTPPVASPGRWRSVISTATGGWTSPWPTATA